MAFLRQCLFELRQRHGDVDADDLANALCQSTLDHSPVSTVDARVAGLSSPWERTQAPDRSHLDAPTWTRRN